MRAYGRGPANTGARHDDLVGVEPVRRLATRRCGVGWRYRLRCCIAAATSGAIALGVSGDGLQRDEAVDVNASAKARTLEQLRQALGRRHVPTNGVSALGAERIEREEGAGVRLLGERRQRAGQRLRRNIKRVGIDAQGRGVLPAGKNMVPPRSDITSLRRRGADQCGACDAREQDAEQRTLISRFRCRCGGDPMRSLVLGHEVPLGRIAGVSGGETPEV